MKLLISIMLLSALSAQASIVFGQRVNLKVQNVQLRSVFREIQKQTNYDFLYVSADLKGSTPVSVNFVDKPLKEALESILKDQPISFEIDKNTVLIKRKSPEAMDRKKVQESIPITGRVTDSLGNALEAVSIRVKNKNITAVSNPDGYYHINVPEVGDVLEFKIIGHTSAEYTVNRNTKVLNVTMKLLRMDIEDVVVIGYGEVNRKDLTGSVGSVNMSEIEKAPVMSFDQALAGRVAGVQVSSADGQPGSEGISIIIRGAGSLTQSPAPLYVVDDFPMENFDASSLNMNDIESIDILKDASATAIYGARGANGVIVIQTKKGTVAQPDVSYSGSYGFQQTIRQIELMNPYEFVKYQRELNNNSEATYNMYTPKDLPESSPFYKPDGKTLEDYRNIPGINWQDMAFRNGNTSIHQLSVRGGTAQTRYSLSGSIFNQQGVILNSGTGRVTGRVAIDQTINKKLKTGVIVNYSNNPSFGRVISGEETHGYSYLLYSVWGYRPVSGREDESGIDEALLNGELDPDSEGSTFLINPIMNLENEDNKQRKINLSGNGYLDYRFNNNLTLRTNAAYMSFEYETTGFYNSMTNRGTPRNPNNRGTQGTLSYTNLNTWKSSTFLTYRKKFNQVHNLNVMAGVDFYQMSTKRYGFSTNYIEEESLGLSGMDDGLPATTSMTLSKNRLNSYFGRVNYDYKSKYLFTATFRADGSSKFPSDNRWGYFPSAAFSWRASNENFLKDIWWISDAKVRASYGLTGNNRVTDFAYMQTIVASNIAEAYSFHNANPSLGYYPGSPGNEQLKWETTRQADIGIDLSLFDKKVEIIADVYRKNTDDLLLYANTPAHTGFTRAYKNIGSLQNDGLELTLGVTSIKNANFSWRSDFNISFNRNKITALTADESQMFSQISWDAIHNNSYLYAAQVGQPAAMFMGYMFDGVYQVEDFTWQGNSDPSIPHESRSYVLKTHLPDNGGDSRDDVQPGDIKYRDLNGDGTINEYDEAVIGNPLPVHMGGFNNTFNYKNFELSVFFQWSYGNEVYNANRIYFEGGRPVNSRNQYATYVNRWTYENPSNIYFRAGGQGPLGRYSSQNVEDASYLRLKTISLSYTLPKAFTNRFKVKNLSVNATAQNLFTWTNYSGMDPEVSVRNTVLTPGFDWSAYPRGRTLVFGIKANL
ncbi:TonB-dependent receptor [Sphingobacterium sp. SGG-5]|uniref:TonB-dependent receptor n=1 Tax=Sphingobacterium sp. SGG-5 TaxID=2710881 RepID=UPI0013EC2CA5|nr:TonB-dependent receptor [Sphingobacterium sp. SGG-5]NGM61268.1 TonB-dependent receptor [Sphingobacterium sp. SGG-5]